MKDQLLETLLSDERGTAALRKTARKLSRVLVDELIAVLKKDEISGEEVTVVTVMPGGVVMWDALMERFPGIALGVVEARKTRKDGHVSFLYRRLPKPLGRVVVVAAFSAEADMIGQVVDLVAQKGGEDTAIYVVGVVISQNDFDALAKKIARRHIIAPVARGALAEQLADSRTMERRYLNI